MNSRTIVGGAVASLLMSAGLIVAADATPAANGDVVKDWGGSVALGLQLTQGNSKELTTSGALALEKLWKTDEWRFGADGAYGVNNFGAKSNETVNTENLHGFADYKHLFTERLYGDARGDAWHDDVADLQNREVIGPAIGYYFIKSVASRLSGEVGADYEHERQASSDSNFFDLRVSERGEHAWGKQAKVWEEVAYLPKIDDFSTYLLISEVGAEASMTKQLALRVVFQDRYNSAPAPGKVPNDLVVMASVVYKFGSAK